MRTIALCLGAFIASLAIEPARAETSPRRREASTSFVAFHTARVKHDLMIFHPEFPGMSMTLRRSPAAAADSAAPSFSFVTPSRADDALAVTRERDRLLLFRHEGRQAGSTALGLGLFSGMTMMSAHLPPPLRILFDGPLHLGPAIFDDGGMGAGVAGTGL